MNAQQILFRDFQSLIIDFSEFAEIDIEFLKNNSPWIENA
jgi:hypothetical protein